MAESTESVDRFREVFERHYGAVLAYALRRSGSVDIAEEVTAAAFTVCWRRLGKVPPEPATLPWLYRVAWRCLANVRRSERRRRQLAERVAAVDPPPSTTATPPETSAAEAVVMRAFGHLRERDREVLRLTTWEGLSHAEVSTILGCSENAVNIRLHRARSALRGAVERLDPGPRVVTDEGNTPGVLGDD